MKTLILMLVITVLFTACNKPRVTNDPTPTPSADRCKITKITYYPQQGSQKEFAVTYNDSLISKLAETTAFPYSNQGYILNFYYYNASGQSLSKRIEYYDSNNPQISFAQTFNTALFGGSFGRGSRDSNFYNNQFQYTGQRNYFYNTYLSNGNPILHQISLIRTTDANGTITESETYTWLNDDIIKADINEPNIAGTDLITYDTTKINKFNILHPEYFLQGLYNTYFFLPNLKYLYLSKHMIKSISSNNPNRNTKTGNFTFTYNSSELMKEIILNGRVITKYEYTCD
jgi:hypothetical protein